MPGRKNILQQPIHHIDIKKHDYSSLIEDMASMSFQARNLASAANIYKKMIEDKSCIIILTLSGSLFSAGLKLIVHDLIMNNMVDIIVSSGANIVDMDFFEALGFKHYIGCKNINDHDLLSNGIDRIYDMIDNVYQWF